MLREGPLLIEGKVMLVDFILEVLLAAHEKLFKRHAKETQILLLLNCQVEAGMKGLDLVNAAPGLLKRGTIYITLAQMEFDGLVEVYPSQDARRIYKITPLGQEELRERVKSSV